MVITLELPFVQPDPLQGYVRRFGDLPAWFDELSPGTARQLARQALRRGTPLAQADHLPG
ncbi:hypothetical protein [Azovibrio restrictus]|uniref:hypothetical protein n=1 Tax=Azovibrio restrictus TaxID=146938 RepID=UPI0004247BED|nr:hypothetical protein [Azovibrio restrictus]MCE1172219.1 hypothetical protein [Azovibrio sp.]MDD3482693.1 hypothetical protein [Azovibrio restrictus]